MKHIEISPGFHYKGGKIQPRMSQKPNRSQETHLQTHTNIWIVTKEKYSKFIQMPGFVKDIYCNCKQSYLFDRQHLLHFDKL